MIQKKISGMRNGMPFQGYGDYFNEDDEKQFNKIYFLWKELNKECVILNSRRNNLPEIISEGLVAKLFNLARTNNIAFQGLSSTSFDCINPSNGETYQIKAVSTMSREENGGPTSFGPRSEYDHLILAHFIVDEDVVLFYQYDDDLNKVMVNKKETFEDQCKAGKRPRFSLLKVIKQQEKLPILSYKFGVDK